MERIQSRGRNHDQVPLTSSYFCDPQELSPVINAQIEHKSFPLDLNFFHFDTAFRRIHSNRAYAQLCIF